jgi:hypothetical protein
MFFVLLVAGFAGGFAHWLNNWAQGRTPDTFFEYLKSNGKRTVAASISIAMAVIASYLANPDVTLNTILLAISSGYMVDSVTNKGNAPAPSAQDSTPVQDTVNEDANKTVDSLLADDSNL